MNFQLWRLKVTNNLTFKIPMLLLHQIDHLKYNDLTSTYMGMFKSSKFEAFLNTTQSGYAHSTAGTDIGMFLKTIYTTLCSCLVQLSFFCFFRDTFKSLYQPRSYYVPLNERIEPLPKGFFAWIMPTLKQSIHNYLSIGLDGYFFIRFLSILLLFFIFMGSLNMFILIPINVTGNSENYSASGLDMLSISNIAPENTGMLNCHFIMSLITIGFFHWLIVYEFQSYVKIRQSYLTSKFYKDTVLSKTLLISNVPEYLLDPEVIHKVFEIIPGGVEKIWHIYDYKDVANDVEEAKEALELLEESEVNYAKKLIRCQLLSKKRIWWLNLRKNKNSATTEICNRLPKVQTFYPPIYLPRIHIPKLDRDIRARLPGFLRVLRFEKRTPMTDWCVEKLNEKHKRIEDAKVKLASGTLNVHKKLFIEFKNQKGAHMAHQCLLSQIQGNLDVSVIEIHPEDIIWQNVARNNSFACLTEKYLVTIAFICIILLYVIPVSFIGLVSQIPLLTKLIPSLRWIYRLPDGARKVIQSILPSILLALLTESVLIVFRFLTYFKGPFSGAELELNLQKWYFVFLFVQQFLVVTILSSVTMLFKQIVDQPTSIPILLATNLPKATTFFYQYISLKALSFCGNNFLRILPLIKTAFAVKFNENTPRQKFRRLTSLPKFRWGSIYPVYSVFSSIGIAYSIIAPLIAIFVIFILGLLLIFYKYALRYIYSHLNESDTRGRLYPMALLHLYTGLYCLECCLIGIFFLLKDEQNTCPMFVQGWVMIITLLATIFGNLTIYNRFEKHFSYLPILSDKKFEDEREVLSLKLSNKNNIVPNVTQKLKVDDTYLNTNLLFLHPALKYEKPKLWLPEDPLHITEERIKLIEKQITGLRGGSIKGARMEIKNNDKKITISISEAPPDYK